MGWFDQQIKERAQTDDTRLKRAYWSLACVINHKSNKAFSEEYGDKARNAIMEICDYFHLERKEHKDEIQEDIKEEMEDLFNSAGIMQKKVYLANGWWKDSTGPLLVEKKDGSLSAVLEGKDGRYYYWDYEKKKRVTVTQKNASEFKTEAITFYKPLPQKALNTKQLILFLFQNLEGREKRNLLLMGIIITLIGMITPYMTNFLFSNIIPSGQSIMVASIASLLMGTAVAEFLFQSLKQVFMGNIECKMKKNLESAVFSRILNLPTDFFKNYSSGELAERVIALNSICSILCNVLLGTGVTAIFSLLYLGQIFGLAKELFLTASLILLVQLIIAVLGVFGQVKYTEKKLNYGAKVQGIVFSLFSGIQKIKLAGCEKRAFEQWAKRYKKEAEAAYNPPFMVKAQNALAPIVTMVGTFFLYRTCFINHLEVSHYMAFHASYALVSGAILSLAGSVTMLSMIHPILKLSMPVLKAVPEISGQKEQVRSLSGNLELSHVTFHYTPDSPAVLNDINLKIKKGEYIAIVGKTGCGKSTLMRLILGFETPDVGAIYYDGKDLRKLDQKSLHRQIGVVMQNGKLFSGDIFSNITVSAPWLSIEEAWEAARASGLEEDIRRMPMGMYTILSEGGGGISGGQKQRLMIARAIVAHPHLLILDEATSALDNITQKQVSDSLNRMNCTRIVIAHRLSTIKECDRILVLDKGKIVEDGTYEQLCAQKGFFAELVARQQLETEDYKTAVS